MNQCGYHFTVLAAMIKMSISAIDENKKILYGLNLLLILCMTMPLPVTTKNEESFDLAYLENIRVEVDGITEKLERFYHDINDDKQKFRSKYYEFDEGGFTHVPFPDMKQQHEYLKLLKEFLRRIQASTSSTVEKLAGLGRSFLMYNELLEAIEGSADRVLKAATHRTLAATRQIPFQDEARKYLKIMLNLYADEEFVSENESTRNGIKETINLISSESIDTSFWIT